MKTNKRGAATNTKIEKAKCTERRRNGETMEQQIVGVERVVNREDKKATRTGTLF